MSQKVNRPGVTIALGEKKYILPSLTLRQFILYKDVLQSTKDLSTGVEVMEAFVPIIGAALQNNYPEFDVAALPDLLDGNNFVEIARAVQGASGMTLVSELEGE